MLAHIQESFFQTMHHLEKHARRSQSRKPPFDQSASNSIQFRVEVANAFLCKASATQYGNCIYQHFPQLKVAFTL